MDDTGPRSTVQRVGAIEAEVKSYFDSESVAYAASYSAESHVGYFFRCRTRLVRAILADRDPGRLIDVGCGPGVMVDTVLTAGHTYDGVDVSPGMIGVAADSFAGEPDVRFQVARAQQLPFENDTFDTGLCLGVLEYLSREDKLTALRELRRVLVPDGVAVVAVLNLGSPVWFGRTAKRWLRSLVARRPGAATDGSVPPEPFTLRGAQKLLVKAGFSIGSARYYSYNVVPARIFDAQPSLWTKVSNVVERVSRPTVPWIGMGILLVATPSEGRRRTPELSRIPERQSGP